MPPRRGSKPTLPRASARSVRRAREQFLDGDSPDAAGVRAEIEASWVRSRQLSVDTDQVEPEHVERVDHETLLARCAAPVLRALRNELAGEPIGILLTDARGTVLDRQCPDPDMARQLDDARLAPGFVFAESSVGTNGIGTAIEMRQSTMVTGDEHYVGSLKRFGCAGATISHPVTGAFLGIIDFTATTPHSNPLLLTFARSTAQRLQDRLLAHTSEREVALMRDYLATCHHTGGSVLGISEGLVMMNLHTQQRFDLADQTALLAKITDVGGATSPQTLLAHLPSGGTARLDYRPAFAAEGGLAGGVVRVQPPHRAGPARRSLPPPVTSLPGVVGTSAIWQQACRTVLQSRRAGEWLALEGEPGVGRSALLHAVQRAVEPGEPLSVLDAAEAVAPGWLERVSAALEGPPGALILRHVDRLAEDQVTQLTGQLRAHREAYASSWVAMTLGSPEHRRGLDAQLLALFPRTVEVPPLRQHIDDLDRLVPHLLSRIVRGAELVMAPAALNQLKRLPWSGNVEQLYELLVQVTQRRRSGVVGVDDLPGAGRAVSRRQLSPLECLERDAIVAALLSAGGSRSLAAQTLGMSRATIYRRIRDYGIHSE